MFCRGGGGEGSFVEDAPPGFSPPHAAFRTFSTTKENVRSDAHYVGKTGLRLGRVVPPDRAVKAARQGGALARFARPAARCQPSQTRHCRRVVRLGANTLHGASAACPKRRVRRRTVTRPPRAKLPAPQRRPDNKRACFDRTASPGPSPPHAALSFLLRPPGATHPRTRHLGHFSRRRKVSVLMRTKGGVPVLPGRVSAVSTASLLPAR